MEIKYYRKNVYGNELLYLYGNDVVTRAIRSLVGKRTLSTFDVENLTELGLKMVEVLESSVVEAIL